MIISNLPHFEDVSAHQLPLGGASLGMLALAAASGDEAHTSTDTDTWIKANRKVTIAKGTAKAFALGDEHDVYTSYYLEGFDFYKAKTFSLDKKRFSFERTRVIAIDRPG